MKLEGLFKSRQLPGFSTDAEAVERGLSLTPSGDCEEMRLPAQLQQKLTAERHECEGARCRKFSECYYEIAKADALKADIILTNHALLCYNSLRNDNKIFPVRPVLVIDEAHEFERYAINALTQLLEYNSLIPIINHSAAREAIEDDVRQQTMEFNHRFFRAVEGQRPEKTQTSWAIKGEIQEGLALWNSLHQVWQALQRQAANEALVAYTEEMVATLQALAHQEPPTGIRYCQLSDDASASSYDAYQIQYRPLEISEILNRAFFEGWPRVICTSATLGVDGDLGWFQRRLGRRGGQPNTLTIPSPFNYPTNVVLYTPQGIVPKSRFDPPAEEAHYINQVVEEIKKLIEVSRGRAFVLCTSRRQMFRLYEQLAPRLNYPCFCQGKGLSRVEMIERFKASGEAVLFGTRSFWEGIDIPGEALSLVILDKIPFLPKSDPVLERLQQNISAKGGNWFHELQVIPAVTVLRQGAGRLVRSETDRGVIAILDSRLNTNTTYGPTILRSLPNGRHTLRFEEVKKFFTTSD